MAASFPEDLAAGSHHVTLNKTPGGNAAARRRADRRVRIQAGMDRLAFAPEQIRRQEFRPGAATQFDGLQQACFPVVRE